MFMDQGYSIWYITETYQDQQKWNDIEIPNWLRDNVLLFDLGVLNSLNDLKFTKDSFILSYDQKNTKKILYDLKVVTPQSLFSIRYEPLKVADVVLCFGFDSTEFNNFCQQCNLIGKKNGRVINNPSKYDGIAFLITSDDLQTEYEEIIKDLNYLIYSKLFKFQHSQKVLGVTNKGFGLDNMNLNILNGKPLPLLFL